MTPQRIVFAIVLALQTACMTAAHQDLVPKWTPFLTLAGSVLLALMSSIAPSKDEPKSDGPSKLPAVLLFVGACALAGSVQACSLFTPANAQKLIDAGKVACIVEHAFLDDATMNKVCDIVTAAEQAAAKDIAKTHREAVGQRMAAMKAECSDAGADAK